MAETSAIFSLERKDLCKSGSEGGRILPSCPKSPCELFASAKGVWSGFEIDGWTAEEPKYYDRHKIRMGNAVSCSFLTPRRHWIYPHT